MSSYTLGWPGVEIISSSAAAEEMPHVPPAMLHALNQDKTVYTGDILFVGGTPIVWAGPLSNWVAACDLMLDMDVTTVVPGHGPLTDRFSGLGEFVRIAVNVDTVYRSLDPTHETPDVVEQFRRMAELEAR